MAAGNFRAVPARATFAIVQYLGHCFSGWQRQPDQRTVQGDFEAMLERLVGARVVTHAAGRTDAGVHALGQVVSFEIPERWPPHPLLRALRGTAPDGLWVARVGEAPQGFHARKHATARRYRYVVGCDPAARSPFRRPFEWAVHDPLDATALAAAARAIIGEHEFRGFAATGQARTHYRCRVGLAEWQERPRKEGFIFTIEADRFLHRMVRFLVGTMLDIGRGGRPVGDMERLLARTDTQETSPPAPPHGLFLIGARYPKLDEGFDR